MSEKNTLITISFVATEEVRNRDPAVIEAAMLPVLDRLGGLALEVKVKHEPKLRPLTDAEHAVLSQPLDRVLTLVEKTGYIKASRSLHQKGADSVRDVFLLGRSRTGGLDGVGDKTMLAISTKLRLLCPRVPWNQAPTMAQMARLCRSLDDVPFFAVFRNGPPPAGIDPKTKVGPFLKDGERWLTDPEITKSRLKRELQQFEREFLAEK